MNILRGATIALLALKKMMRNAGSAKLSLNEHPHCCWYLALQMSNAMATKFASSGFGSNCLILLVSVKATPLA